MAVQLYTDEESFRKRLQEEAASIPDPAKLIAARERREAAAVPLRASVPLRSTTTESCGKCGGSGRFVSRYGRDVGGCFACHGTGRAHDYVAGRSSSAYSKPAVELPPTKPYPNIRAAFDAVERRGLKKAQITIGDINISLAGKASRNPGALYVKHLGEYAGKLERDKPLQISHKCGSPQTMIRLLDAIELDPIAAITAQAKTDADRVREAVAAGLEPIVPCCCCGIYLTDPESRERGIGPICGSRWGLAGFKLAAEALSIDDL